MIGVNPMKILLIEDDTQLCMTIKEQLTKSCESLYEFYGGGS